MTLPDTAALRARFDHPWYEGYTKDNVHALCDALDETREALEKMTNRAEFYCREKCKADGRICEGLSPHRPRTLGATEPYCVQCGVSYPCATALALSGEDQ